MRVLFLCLFIALVLKNEAQTACDCYERLEALAYDQFLRGKPALALKSYQRALSFKDDLRNKEEEANLAMYLIANNKFDEALVALTSAYEKGYHSIEHEYYFKSIVDSAVYFNQLKNVKPKIAEQEINWTYYNQIQGLWYLDQAVRRREDLKIKTSGDSLPYRDVDSINFMQIFDLVKAYGYPTIKNHGFNGNKLNLFSLHASVYSEALYKKVKDLVDTGIKACACKKSFLALLEDRRRDWVFRTPQAYGTWNGPDYFSDIEDLSKVDSLRYTMNLLSLESHAFQRGLVLPANYIKQDYPNNYFCEKGAKKE